ncbi:MAG TPA: extracellular solute-binding protein [Chloroflexota bacterium]|nr:extracellular solute-binding protein [Chloroflexota bacterium]
MTASRGWLGMAALALALASCGQAAAPPPVRANASDDWAKLVAAGEKEGTVVVTGSGNTDLTESFGQRFPRIKVEYTPIAGSQLPPKILAERAAGKSFTDVLLHGSEAAMVLRDAGALAELAPYVDGPDVQPSKWRDGKLQFVDNDGKYIVAYSAYAKLGPAINAQQVDPKQFTGWNDLLDPKWKGKIMAGDPNAGGAAFGMAWYWYVTPGFGKPFLEQLFKQQNVALSRNNQQAINAVAQGKYAVGIGIGDNSVAGADMKGLGAKAIDWQQLKDPPYLTAGLGGLAVPKDPPHPNATRVYLNWLLSREGQTAISKAANLPSLRQDVPVEGLFPPMVPKPGVSYFVDYTENAIRQKQKDAAAIKDATS